MSIFFVFVDKQDEEMRSKKIFSIPEVGDDEIEDEKISMFSKWREETKKLLYGIFFNFFKDFKAYSSFTILLILISIK